MANEEERGATQLRVMADYFAEPVWARHGHGPPVTLDSLELPDDLKARLRRWAERYNALEATDYEWPSAKEQGAFNAAGEELAREVQDVLGPAWDVSYQGA